jgi:uncharacterized lipoprotein YmbA
MRVWGLWLPAVVLLSRCAAPPLTTYTLATPPVASDAVPLAPKPVVVAVARIMLPDALDTQDIVVRNGSTLRRSSHGRWASRLSLSITDRVTQRLAQRRPDMLVTDRPLSESPTYRVLVNIGRLDVGADGVAVLDADWLVVPGDPRLPTLRNRGLFTATGPVATDLEVVDLVGVLSDQLAGAIDIGRG